MKFFTVLIITFLCSIEVRAEERNSLLYLCCSLHHGGAENENHRGLVFEHEIQDNWGVVVGTYQNSQDRRSNLVGLRWDSEISTNWDVFVVGGYVTGYDTQWGAIPGLEYRNRLQLYVTPGEVYALGLRVVSW